MSALSRPANRSTAVPAALLLLATGHFLVDTVACLVQPLWPTLGARVDGSQGTEFRLYIIWTLAGSLSQLLFGYFGDRFHGRWLIWVGPLVSVLCMSTIGLATTPIAAGTLLLLGGLGTAAFHPEAATAAGEAAPQHRSRAMSIFYIGGYMGQAAGPYYGGWMADRFSLPGLAWGIPFGLAGVIALAIGLRRWHATHSLSGAPQRTEITKGRWKGFAGRPTIPLRQVIRGKQLALGLVLVISTLRVMVAMGVPLALAYLLDDRGATKSQTGLAQSMLLGGIGAGAILCAWKIRHHHERLVLWLLPIGVAPLVMVLPWLSGDGLLVLTAAAGVFLGVALPVMASYGQQLLPDGQRIASSWTMGVSWGLGGTIGAEVIQRFRAAGRIDLCFACFALCALISSFLCIWLPKLEPHSRASSAF